MTDGSLIRLDRVEKRYGPRFRLQVDELTIGRGDQLAVYGSNGSGKSTLLRLMVGVSRPDHGTVQLDPDIEHRAVGFVPQSGGLYGHLTVRQNLLVRRRIYGLGGALDAPHADRVARLGLEPFLDRRFDELSGGYQRLAALAAALVSEPHWLVLDEVSSGVDEKKREALAAILKELAGELALLVLAAPEHEPVFEPGRVLRLREGSVE